MATSCIFCKIIKGEVPSFNLVENEHVIAFLDIAPVAPGHTLVIPKRHIPTIHDLPDDLLSPVLHTVRDIASALSRSLRADGISISQVNGACAGQVVPHLHFHVIPRHRQTPLQWHPGSYADETEKATYAEKIRGALSEK